MVERTGWARESLSLWVVTQLGEVSRGVARRFVKEKSTPPRALGAGLVNTASLASMALLDAMRLLLADCLRTATLVPSQFCR